MRFSPPYSAYARVYDQIGQRVFGERMASVVLELLRHRSFHPASVLDLGCGTGAATIAFARSGLSATGLDRSPEMLARARAMANSAGTPVEFIEGDMTDVHLNDRFDLVTSIYDSVNYLDGEEAFMRFARSAYRSLTANGYLIFDMNTRHRLMSSWEQGMLVAGDTDDYYVTYRSWYDEEIDASPLVLTAFVREDKNCWTRFDEEHVERSWPIALVSQWLEEAGFNFDEVVGYIDSTGDPIRPASEEHGRVVFVAAR